jgi:hypothetical protein
METDVGTAEVPPTVTSQAPPAEARPAQVGVGLQGQSLKNESGIGKAIAQPAMVLFQTKEKMVFEVQIPQALQLFNGLEGRLPETHEEFMDKIIKFNQIKLPKLPEGQEYRYRPDKGELWVEPTSANSP